MYGNIAENIHYLQTIVFVQKKKKKGSRERDESSLIQVPALQVYCAYPCTTSEKRGSPVHVLFLFR